LHLKLKLPGDYSNQLNQAADWLNKRKRTRTVRFR
jgi:hypothetical protein